MTRRLADYRAEIPTGLHPDLPDEQTPLWEDGRNVGFHERGVRPTPGQILVFGKISSNPVLGLLDQLIDGVKTVFWGSEERIARGVEGTFDADDVTRTSGLYSGSSELWSLAPFGNLTFAARLADNVQVRIPSSANEFVDLDTVSDLAATFRANILKVVEQHLVAFGTDNSPYEIRWSDEDDYTVWSPLPGNHARDIQARDLNSPIVAAVDLPQGVGVYSSNQLHLFQFIGAPFFFGQDHLLTGIGAVSKHSVVIGGGGIHYGFGPQGIFRTDGASYQYIDQPSIHDFIYKETLDPTKIGEVIAWHSAMLNTVFFSYPTLDGFGLSVGFNYANGTWSIHEFYRRAASTGEVWGSPIVGSNTGSIYEQGGVSASPSAEAVPVSVTARQVIDVGYGDGGYGEGGYGGAIEGDG